MQPDTLESRRSRAPDPRALLAASAGWLILMIVPRVLAGALDPVAAHACAFAATALWLGSARRHRGARASHAIALFALAALAGYAAAPAWIAGIGWAGVGLGLTPPAPAHPEAAVPVWVAAVALGPLAEELVYRDRLLRALRPLGAALAIGATSLVFALSHRGAFAMLATGCIGVALGAAMWRTRSLAVCAGYHAGLNAAALAGGVPPTGRLLGPAAGAAIGASLAAAAIRLAGRRALPGCAAVAIAVPALAGAEALAFDAELRFEPLPSSFPPIGFSGAGVATANGAGAGIALETLALDGGIAGTVTVPVTDPTVGGVNTIEVSASLGAGTLGPFQPPAPVGSRQLAAATLAVRGEIRFCFVYAGCEHSVIALGLDDTTWSGAQVGVGVGGVVTNTPVGVVRLSLHGAPWTVRTATLPVETPAGGSFAVFTSGFAHGPASFTGSTAQAGGRLELVTPIRMESLGAAPAVPMFGRLAIQFVPEPAPALLFSAGGLAIALAARRRGARGGSR